MNFASASVKLKSKPRNEDFCFDTETPSGHLFVVFDFNQHDYANLNITLKSKLEPLVKSLLSIADFPINLFLGFLAREANNFIFTLGHEDFGPKLTCSAAICFLRGNELSYLLCGDAQIKLFTGSELRTLKGASLHAPAQVNTAVESNPEQPDETDLLGFRSLEAPLTDRVQVVTIKNQETILILTHGVEDGLGPQQLLEEISKVDVADSKLTRDTLMKASAGSPDDRTLIVISGPYKDTEEPVAEEPVEPATTLESQGTAIADSVDIETTQEGKPETTPETVTEIVPAIAAKTPPETTVETAPDITPETAPETVTEIAPELSQKTTPATTATTLATTTEEIPPQTAPESTPQAETRLEQKLGQLMEMLTLELDEKATKSDLLELNQRLKQFDSFLEGKSDTIDGNKLAADAPKAAVAAKEIKAASERPRRPEPAPSVQPALPSKAPPSEAAPLNVSPVPAPSGSFAARAQERPVRKASLRETLRAQTESNRGAQLRKAATFLLIAAAGMALGAWLESMVARSPERWTVKTSGSQVSILRRDSSGSENVVSLNVVRPFKSSEERSFSTFAEVQQYIEKVSASEPTVGQSSEAPQVNQNTANKTVTEVTVQRGDTLAQLARKSQTTEAILKDLNPNVANWLRIRHGQKINVPYTSAPAPASTNAAAQVSGKIANPTSVGPRPQPVRRARTPAAIKTDGPANPNASITNAQGNSVGNTTQVTVVRGDSLEKIAERYNSTPAKLRELNPRLPRSGLVQLGQKVVVPSAAAQSQTSTPR